MSGRRSLAADAAAERAATSARLHPQPAPLFETALVELQPGQQGCADEIGLLPRYQLAQPRVGTFGKPAAPLELTLTAPGYREVARLAPTYVDNAVAEVPFRGPAKASEGSVCIANRGHVCIANRGHVRIALYASSDRMRSRSTTLVDGKLYPANFDLAFYAFREGTWLHRHAALRRAQRAARGARARRAPGGARARPAQLAVDAPLGPGASIASVMRRVMIQADAALLERARRAAQERGVTFPQLVRDALEHELASRSRLPRALSCAGVISTRGEARERNYEPDAWR